MSKVYDSLKTIALSFPKFSAKFAITMTLPFAQVLDVNDNAPVFTQLRYQTTVLEGSPARQLVLTVSATDIDTTKEEIVYSLDQTGLRYFTIGRKTGEILTSTTPLDREKTPVLSFTVLASDGKHTGMAGIKVKYGTATA